MQLLMLTGFMPPINTLLPSGLLLCFKVPLRLAKLIACILTISSHIIKFPAILSHRCAPSRHLFIAFYFIVILAFSTNTSISLHNANISLPSSCDIFTSYFVCPTSSFAHHSYFSSYFTSLYLPSYFSPPTWTLSTRPPKNPNTNAFLLHIRFSPHVIRITSQNHPSPPTLH